MKRWTGRTETVTPNTCHGEWKANTALTSSEDGENDSQAYETGKQEDFEVDKEWVDEEMDDENFKVV